MCARTSSAVGKGGELGRVAGGEVTCATVGALVVWARLVEWDGGLSGEAARELVVEPLGDVCDLGMPSLSLMRFRAPSDISPPEPARPSLSLPEPAVVLCVRFFGTAVDEA